MIDFQDKACDDVYMSSSESSETDEEWENARKKQQADLLKEQVSSAIHI